MNAINIYNKMYTINHSNYICAERRDVKTTNDLVTLLQSTICCRKISHVNVGHSNVVRGPIYDSAGS